MKTDTVKVIFRKMGKINPDVIAFFPELPGDSNPYRTMLCYEHTGQHSAAAVDFYHYTLPASESEYADLKAELESIGYNLRVCKRMTRGDLQARIKACEV